METFLSILPIAYIVIAVINLILAIIQIKEGDVKEGIFSIAFMIFGFALSILLKNHESSKLLIVIVDIAFAVVAVIGFFKQMDSLNEGIAIAGGVLNLIVFICTIVSLFTAVVGAILGVLSVVVAGIFGGSSSRDK